MKLNFYYTGLFVALASLSATQMFTSCADEPDKYEVADGLPTVKYVRLLSSEIVGNNDEPGTHYTNGELVTSANPGSVICLVGDNLRSVYQMYFNDKKAILNTSYMTDNTLICNIPSDVPKSVSDKIYMITQKNDTVKYDFKVVIDKPVIYNINNEYVKAGEKATIVGRYFIPDDVNPFTITMTKTDGSEFVLTQDDVEISEDYTTVSFVMPEDIASAPFVLSSVYGKTTTPFHYMDRRGLLFDFDTVVNDKGETRGNHGWHNMAIESDENSYGNYVRLGDGSTSIDNGSWNDGAFSFEYWPGAWQDPETFTDPLGIRLTDLFNASEWENMTLKFEMNIPASNPWTCCAMQIIPSSIKDVTTGNAGAMYNGVALPGCNNTYFNSNKLPRALYRPWTETGSFDTNGEWMTVSLPIKSSFVYGADGTAALSGLSAESFAGIVFYVWSGGTAGEPCAPIIKLDNIRIVPNK